MKLFLAFLLIGAVLADDDGMETEENTKTDEKRGGWPAPPDDVQKRGNWGQPDHFKRSKEDDGMENEANTITKRDEGWCAQMDKSMCSGDSADFMKQMCPSKCAGGGGGGGGGQKECTNIQKLTDAASFTAELKKYDIVIVGRSTCGATTYPVKQLARQEHKAKCAFYYYDKQGKSGGWFNEVWRLVRASGWSGGSIRLPFGFHCAKYAGAYSEVLAAKDKTC